MRLCVLVLEDEPAVRDALARDLEPLADTVRIEPAEDVPDADRVLAQLADDGDALALVLADHRLPGTTGVEFLVRLRSDAQHAACRKVLVTGQADQQDTIRAVNEAGLDRYIAKPWDPEELLAITREQLTDYVLDTGADPLPHLPALDTARVLPKLGRRGDR